ncbi:MAG: aldo/keto reductase, partial [Eggerthellaceae bacterium]|nr:aldo/keto reductase [Eggerthellaceae bacterium]
MYYRSMCGCEVSALGFGAMRLPVIDGQEGQPDEQAVFEMVDYAIEKGVNYFDTAWGYHDGKSEIIMGKALARHPRDSFYVATKFPGYDNGNFGKHEELFAKQLEKMGVDYVDFYLMHNVCESNIENYLADDRFGTISYFLGQKEAGKITHLGFSCHGNVETLGRFLEAYGDKMEFCQLQLNYMDWDVQDARRKVAMLAERNLPVIVLEPLRGGGLITFTEDEQAKLESFRPGASAVDWEFR